MSKTVHQIYLSTMALIVLLTTIFLSYKGYSYYTTPLEERFYHPDHLNFKAAGLYGHGLGIIGTLLMLFGVVIYIIRKRYKFFARWGRLKYWLEFHIFLCSLGPVMILFHTAFKFGGVVSIAFWSMVAVVVSGIIGRYIYIQIPRSIEGRELSLNEIKASRNNLSTILIHQHGIAQGAVGELMNTMQFREKQERHFLQKRRKVTAISRYLRQLQLPKKVRQQVLRLVKEELTLNQRIERLQTMQHLFRYWHVAHMPFAIIMLVIVVVHVAITLAFGYTWIF